MSLTVDKKLALPSGVNAMEHFFNLQLFSLQHHVRVQQPPIVQSGHTPVLHPQHHSPQKGTDSFIVFHQQQPRVETSGTRQH